MHGQAHTHWQLVALGVLVAGALALLLLPASARGAGGTIDFGDAPDGAPAGYASAPGVLGKFPSKAASQGPRHTVLDQLLLGAKQDGEADSMQVNADRFDDGAMIDPRACSDRSRLTAVVGAAGLAPDKLTADHIVYVNVWADWNRDGDWDDSAGCAREWAIENLPISAERLAATKLYVAQVNFKAGAQVKELWWRVQVTLDEPAVDPSGRALAPYAVGETEDHLYRNMRSKTPPPVFDGGGGGGGGGKKDKGRFEVSCNPNPALVFHGQAATVKFVIVDTRKKKGVIFGRGKPRGKKPGQADVIPKPKPWPKGIPPGWFPSDHFVVRTKKDPPTRIETITFEFVFSSGRQSQKLTCTVVVVHLDLNLFPPIGCVDRCAGDLGPQVALDANFTGTWRRSRGTPPGATIETEMIGMDLRCIGPLSGPLTGVRITPGAQTPAWPAAQLDPTATIVQPGNVRPTCKLAAPRGGSPSLDCIFPEVPAGGTFSSFFHVYPVLSFTDSTKVSVELLRQGEPVGRAELPLAPPQ